jgi:hypothetical protein
MLAAQTARMQRAWYARGRRRDRSRGGHVCAPWWPGQCIDCSVVGAAADASGTYCGELRQSACHAKGMCEEGERHHAVLFSAVVQA